MNMYRSLTARNILQLQNLSFQWLCENDMRRKANNVTYTCKTHTDAFCVSMNVTSYYVDGIFGLFLTLETWRPMSMLQSQADILTLYIQELYVPNCKEIPDFTLHLPFPLYPRFIHQIWKIL